MIFFAFCWFFAILSCSSSADPMTASGTYKQGIMLANSKRVLYLVIKLTIRQKCRIPTS